MFYSQVILAKKGPLAKVWMAANWGDKKLARPQIFATDISQSCTDIMNPSVPFALRLSGQLLLGVVRIYSRKVKYVLNDCTEAMVKLQMAFTKASTGGANAAGGNRELLTDQDAPTNNLVSNFGEYDQVHVVEGFCLPLPEDNEWILAEDDDEDNEVRMGGGGTHGRGQRAILLAAHMPSQSQRSPFGGGGSNANQHYASPEEETWAPFDPDNEDDEDDEEDDQNVGGGSRVSDIEMVRAANDSLLSDDQTRRASSILDKSDDLPGRSTRTRERDGAAAAAGQDEDDFDMSHVPFDDDSEGGPPNPEGTEFGPTVDDSMLQLSHDGGSNRQSRSRDMSGLDESNMQMTPGSKRTIGDLESEQGTVPRPKRRKRRKVVIDNNKTELSNEYIRAMLQDTSDIVRRMVPPSMVWEDDDGVEMGASVTLKGKLEPPVLTRPFLADEEQNGGPRLHPRLQKLWTDNFYKALGQPCPYRQETSLEAEEDVEQVRRNQGEEEDGEDDDDMTKHSDLDMPMRDTTGPDGTEHPQDDFEMPAMDDEEQEEPADGANFDFDEEQDEQGSSVSSDVRDRHDDLDLGLVNELEIEEEEENEEEERQTLGDVASSATKWHKHTVRVLQHLQQNMRDPDRSPDDEDDNEEYESLPDHLQFQQISKNVSSRRNAASVFFELLQLKTWDFIELDQNEAYGDITISPGVRFHEPPPSN